MMVLSFDLCQNGPGQLSVRARCEMNETVGGEDIVLSRSYQVETDSSVNKSL